MKLWHPLLALALAGAAVTYHLVDQHHHEAQLGQMRADSDSVPSSGTNRRRAFEPAEVEAQLHTAFASEEADSTWTTQAQATARTRLAAALPETSSLRSVECRSSMCRFETIHEDEGHIEQFMQKAFISGKTQIWNGGQFSTTVPEAGTGKLVVVSYLARDGKELHPPRLPQ